MNNITKNYKIGILSIFVSVALLGSIATFGNNMAYAGGSSNDAEQGIEQGQSNGQNAQCVSGEFVLASCNNLNVQLQEQLGNLALGQQ